MPATIHVRATLQARSAPCPQDDKPFPSPRVPAIQNQRQNAKISIHITPEEFTVPDPKHEKHKKNEKTSPVIDRRPFPAEGELRKEVVEEKKRESQREAILHPPASAAAEPATKIPPPP